MKKYLHNSKELFDSPQYGWEQMQFLLEKNLPQQESSKATPLLTYIIAASFMAIFLLSSLVIKNAQPVFMPAGNNHFIAAITSPGRATVNTIAATMEENKIQQEVKDPQQVFSLLNHTKQVALMSLVTQPGDELRETSLPAYRSGEEPLHCSIYSWDVLSTGIFKKVSEKNIPASNEPTPGTLSKADTKNKTTRKDSWEMAAGLAVNAVTGEKQNLRPYPIATLTRNINDQFFVSLGASVASPVSVSSKGVDKTVYVNDTARNVSYYNNVKYYSRLSYADVPLMAGVRINKRLAIQGGVQASVLLNTKTSRAVDSYDIQMSMNSGLPATTFVGIPVVSEENYKVEARRVDLRFTGGIKYTINNTSVHLNYQYAPKTVLRGDQVSKNKNELITVGLQWKLK